MPVQKKPRLTCADVLRYRPSPASRSTVRRFYAQWRSTQALPVRCDIATCTFHTNPLIWGGKRLPLILDHISGNKLDNQPKNLRYLCPNCDSQLGTKGGGNRGRVLEAKEGTFVLADRDGKRHYTLIADPLIVSIRVSAAESSIAE